MSIHWTWVVWPFVDTVDTPSSLGKGVHYYNRHYNNTTILLMIDIGGDTIPKRASQRILCVMLSSTTVKAVGRDLARRPLRTAAATCPFVTFAKTIQKKRVHEATHPSAIGRWQANCGPGPAVVPQPQPGQRPGGEGDVRSGQPREEARHVAGGGEGLPLLQPKEGPRPPPVAAKPMDGLRTEAANPQTNVGDQAGWN